MALVLNDRVKETTSTTGTSDFALSGAQTGFQSFSAGVGANNTTYYSASDGTEWEVGLGTLSADGLTLARTTVLQSSNADAKVSFGSGEKSVFVTYPASQAVVSDAAQTLTNKTISADDNTLSGIAASSFVLSNASGNIDGSAAQKAIPSGVVVGTTDTQTLTNKTISGSNNTITNVSLTSGVTGTLPVANGGTGATTLTGIIKGNGTGAFTAVTAPSGTIVGTTDTQTLTNKTLGGVVLNDGYTEEVFAVSGTTPALSPTNGSIQTWTLSGNSTPTAGTWAAGQSITLMIDDGTAYTITWTSLAVTWKTDAGSAPTLNATGITAIQLWKVGTTIYGARVGDN